MCGSIDLYTPSQMYSKGDTQGGTSCLMYLAPPSYTTAAGLPSLARTSSSRATKYYL